MGDTRDVVLTRAERVELGKRVSSRSGRADDARIANLSAHKTAKVRKFLEDNPKVQLHFTPTYSSWLNKVELWFSKIERDLIHRGVFTSAKDLSRKIMLYIRKYTTTLNP